MINSLKCIGTNIMLDTCAKKRWRKEVSNTTITSIFIQKKIERLLAKKCILFYGTLVFNVLYRVCSSHTTFVGLLYLRRGKSKNVNTGYKIKTTECLNLHIESESHHVSIQITLCIFSQLNNIQKYFYLVFSYVIFIIIMFASTIFNP